MAESVVSLTYGAALFEAAKELGKEDEILGELETLETVLEETFSIVPQSWRRRRKKSFRKALRANSARK